MWSGEPLLLHCIIINDSNSHSMVTCRYTMPDLHGFPGNNLLNHTAPRLQNNSSSNPHSQLPSFPVSVIQNREGSPTKSIFGTSPTGSSSVGVGRRSPIHDMQMDAIAEDCTEDSATPTELNAPVSIATIVNNHSPPSPRMSRLQRASVGEQSAGLMMPQAGGRSPSPASRPTTPSSLQAGDGGESRRRRSGAISPALQEQIQASIQTQQTVDQLPSSTLRDVLQNGRNHPFQPVVSDSNQLMSKPAAGLMSQDLMSMLQSPLPSNPGLVGGAGRHHTPQLQENGQGIRMTNHSPPQAGGVPVHSSYLYANALNHYNSQLSGNSAAFHAAVMPTATQHHHHLIQPNSPFHHHHHHNPHSLPHHPPTNTQPSTNVQDVLSHVSSVLNHCGIQYRHSNGVFAVDHQGVRLHILVCHLASQQNAIQLQYVAGDASQYQTLCSHLYSRLTATTLAAQ